jgi:hypothetical protein
MDYLLDKNSEPAPAHCRFGGMDAPEILITPRYW